MDFSVLLTAPVIVVLLLVAVAAAWIGYGRGAFKEQQAKQLALQEADAQASELMATTLAEHADRLEVLKKAATNDLDSLRRSDAEKLERLQTESLQAQQRAAAEHAQEIARLGEEHSALIDRLNQANLANINALKAEGQGQIEALEARHAALLRDLEQRSETALEAHRRDAAGMLAAIRDEHRQTQDELRGEQLALVTHLKQGHAEALQQTQSERDQRVAEAERRGADLLAAEQARNAALGQEIEELRPSLAALERQNQDLQAEILETRLQNRFSVSKSGEKLVRVVRSVQELANELDETSRAVTGGAYSFFEEIKDQRDREAVLSLTGVRSKIVEAAQDPLETGPEQGAVDSPVQTPERD